MNRKYMTHGALMVGVVIPPQNLSTGQSMGCMPQNQERLLKLALNYRLRRHSDGWFVDGKAHRSQIWEFGEAKLGLTVVGPRFVQKMLKAGDWLMRKSIGDDEANFYCDWTDENLLRLVNLIGLQKRKGAKSL